MKERIVIPKDKIKVLTSCGHFPANGYFTFYKEDAEVEQVPETFEELKELVRETIYEDFENGVKMGQCIKIEYILIDGKSFMPDGEILDEDNDVFAKNRTPNQMWQIIKSLIGEE